MFFIAICKLYTFLMDLLFSGIWFDEIYLIVLVVLITFHDFTRSQINQRECLGHLMLVAFLILVAGQFRSSS